MNLRTHIIRRIEMDGPITVADFMADCLLHPEWGYYTTRDPFGTDFITAPEISQMFGELLGLCLAQSWIDQGAPDRFALTELGPGRGTLMADLLRATKDVQGFHTACDIHLIEASPVLLQHQKQALCGYDVTWHDDIDCLPNLPLYLIANEFFDALPIRQFLRQNSVWHERMVGLSGDDLNFGLTGPVSAPQGVDNAQDGDLVETCAPATAIMEQISGRISALGGMALVIDYGDWQSLGDTLQALHAHDPVNPLKYIGQADLTAHVDFAALAHASSCAHTRLTPQGVFLERLGITARANALAANLSGASLETHVAAHRRLTHPAEMGTLFKVMGFYPKDMPPPAGLDP